MSGGRLLIEKRVGLSALVIVWVGVTARGPFPTPNPPADIRPDSGTALAKKLLGPIGDLYSFPFWNNTDFDYEPHKAPQDILDVQPVIPIHVTENWIVVTRTVLALIWQPSLQHAKTLPFETGPTTLSAFLAPANPVDGWLWEFRPADQEPAISLRPSAPTSGAAVQPACWCIGPWVASALISSIRPFGETSGLGGTHSNSFLRQSFIYYNFGRQSYAGHFHLLTAAGVDSTICSDTQIIRQGNARCEIEPSSLPH
jgi:hypothetical protein